MINTKIGLIIVFVAEDGAVPYSQQKQDQALLIAKFRLKLKKVTKRVKGLDLIECLKNYGQRSVTL